MNPAALGPTHLKQEVKEEKPCPTTLQDIKVEQREREAEEEGTAIANTSPQVAMDVDSKHLEGEHLTQAREPEDYFKGQKAAAQGMKHVAHAKAASKKEPKTEDQTHQTAATGRTLHGDNAAPAAPPSKANPEGSQGPPDQASGFDVTGYHAKRREFDPEYDNDAECVIADMEFTDADTEEDRQLKLRMLEIYNKRLDEREARHDFLAEHGLLNMRKVQALDRRRTGPERDTHAKLRVFARYSAPAEHDNLVEGLLLEQRLRSRIEELKENRRQGARTIADAEAMESDRKQKAKGQAQPSTQRAAGSSWSSLPPLGVTPLPGPTPFPTAPSPYFPAATPQRNFHDNFAAPGTMPLPLLSPLPPANAAAPPSGPAALTAPGAAPPSAPAAAQPLGNTASTAATPQGSEAAAAQSLGLPVAGARLQGILAGATPVAAAHPAEGGHHHQEATKALVLQRMNKPYLASPSYELAISFFVAPPPGGNKGAAAALASWRTRRGVALDISCMPGVELLGARERELCATSRLHPAHYLALKDMMLRDCARHGTISRQEARTFFRLDASRSLRLYDLWVQLGWVSAPATQKKAVSGFAGETGTMAGAATRAASEDGDFEETI
ncbi:hypothetical protein DUNSADRAFT_10263 [Dunaliella salina]|nr:hypothetical protein DUNSADRAFT_10263 [Dunaliella salina]|eukprot:KAF5833437.1 hypothetical protein DUNSADRAFT_10263 [Dunaliella salina]